MAEAVLVDEFPIGKLGICCPRLSGRRPHIVLLIGMERLIESTARYGRLFSFSAACLAVP